MLILFILYLSSKYPFRRSLYAAGLSPARAVRRV